MKRLVTATMASVLALSAGALATSAYAQDGNRQERRAERQQEERQQRRPEQRQERRQEQAQQERRQERVQQERRQERAQQERREERQQLAQRQDRREELREDRQRLQRQQERFQERRQEFRGDRRQFERQQDRFQERRQQWREQDFARYRNYFPTYRAAPYRYRAGAWYAPRGYSYRPYRVGYYFPPVFRDTRYVIYDPYRYRLRPAPYGYRWYRYGDDAVLVALSTGLIASVIGGLFYY